MEAAESLLSGFRRTGIQHCLKQGGEFAQAGGGNDNARTFALAFLSNSQKPAPAVLFQVKNKRLSLNIHMPGFQRIFSNGRLGWKL